MQMTPEQQEAMKLFFQNVNWAGQMIMFFLGFSIAGALVTWKESVKFQRFFNHWKPAFDEATAVKTKYIAICQVQLEKLGSEIGEIEAAKRVNEQELKLLKEQMENGRLTV